MHISMTSAYFRARQLIYSLFDRIWWPKLRVFVSKSISAYNIFKKTKESTSLTTGLLHPLPIPILRFTSWCMDFVTDFPLSQGYNAIFVYVDYFLKYTKLIPCFMGGDLLTAEQVALLFFQNMV